MKSSPIELQFEARGISCVSRSLFHALVELERLKRYLIAHPEKSAQLAMAYFEDFSILAAEYKQLQTKYNAIAFEVKQT